MKFHYLLTILAVLFASCEKKDDLANPDGTTTDATKAGEYVDLGLSVKWATLNIGATAPEKYGDYYAWGATVTWYAAGKSDGYTWNNAPYQTANTTKSFETKWTKYLGSTTSNHKDPTATDADALKTVLDLSDDAARANWGGSWRIPTIEEWEELNDANNCNWEWTIINGINGYKVQSLKAGYTDKWIFLPAAGFRHAKNRTEEGVYGYYWSSSLSIDSPITARYFNINSISHDTYNLSRYYGLSIRPVCQ